MKFKINLGHEMQREELLWLSYRLSMTLGDVYAVYHALKAYIAKTAPRCAPGYARGVLLVAGRKYTAALHAAMKDIVSHRKSVAEAFRSLFVDVYGSPSGEEEAKRLGGFVYVNENGNKTIRDAAGTEYDVLQNARTGHVGFTFRDLTRAG